MAEWVTVEDATGRAAGQVSVSARWIKPLRTGGDPGPHGLSAEEVEGLMARFSPEKDGQVCHLFFCICQLFPTISLRLRDGLVGLIARRFE